MTTKNDITGDDIKSKANNQNYQNNYDAIFKKCKFCANTGKTQDLLDETKQVNCYMCDYWSKNA